ncbi:hypothetical protein GYMLUDRAFT_251688 [Collybiopsis luxurians FD-317 M1]|uniref:Uncharacterized protein n=1 Tax=Collybiopsis luxurians FD-317 M1 TaxID=944289 RepID=A0A0D0CAF8_9AGAR|nr:hypothetical protein GYMLUDRAFT_251688 [Collybiopsis luxurians FD-317 M1]
MPPARKSDYKRPTQARSKYTHRLSQGRSNFVQYIPLSLPLSFQLVNPASERSVGASGLRTALARDAKVLEKLIRGPKTQPPELSPFLNRIKAESTRELLMPPTRGISMNHSRVDVVTGLLTPSTSEFYTNCIEVFSATEPLVLPRRGSSANHFRDAATSTERRGADTATPVHDISSMRYADDTVNLFDPYAGQIPFGTNVDIATASYCDLEANPRDDLSFSLNSYSTHDLRFNQGAETLTVNANPFPWANSLLE